MTATYRNPVAHSASFRDFADEWDQHRYFFDQGLRFECCQCGACCTGDPGVVMVDGDERDAIARHLGMSGDQFSVRYCRHVESGWSIREDAGGACVFHTKGCSIYPARPRQCRTYPFWVRNLSACEAWEMAARECPGIGKGQLRGREEIMALLADGPSQRSA